MSIGLGHSANGPPAMLTLLAEADRRLAQSLDAGTIADELARLVARGTHVCSVHLFVDGVLKTMACVRASELEGPTPSPSQRKDSDATVLVAATTGRLQCLDREGPGGVRVRVAVQPINVHEESFGAVEVEATDLTEDDLSFLEILAHRAGAALYQARLIQNAEEARWAAELQAEYAKRLQSVTSGLSEAITAQDMGAIVVRQAIDGMGGHLAGVAQISEDGTVLETIACRGIPDEIGQQMSHYALTNCLPMAVAFRERRELFFESAAEWADAYPELDEALRGVLALACLPLTLAGGRTVGVLFLGFSCPHRFLETERAFLRTLSQQLAQTLDRARLFEAERRMRVSAEEANRAKDEFLSMVSHELRTPLSAIFGWLYVLRKPRRDDAKRERAIDGIERNARAQTRIIEDILDVSRIVTGKLRLDLHAAKLNDVVRAAIDVVQPAADAKGIALHVRMEQVPTIAGDPERLQQIVWNLLSNAIRFTPPQKCVFISVERTGAEIRLVVTDEGIGIDESLLPFVFDRFRQGDGSITRRQGGLGLGLAIVRHLVELHGGSVSAQSDGPNRGASFTVRFPIAARVADLGDKSILSASRVKTRAPAATVPLDDLRVLLVEDDSDCRDAYTELLLSCRAVVRSVDSADMAMQALDEFRPDVLLSDIGLPGEDGYSLLARVRALGSPRANVPAVALTALAAESDVRRARHAGFFAHLAKPVDPGELSATLAAAARGFAGAPNT